MKPRTKLGTLAVAVAAVSLILSGCSSTGGGGSTAGGAVTHVKGAPSWCGTKKISLALLDGFGGNSWRLVTTASGKDEASKCPSVTKYLYADGQGNVQKAISDIKGMVSTGVNAMVVFPDAGQAILPALTTAYKAGVVTVPYRVFPGGKAGVNYDKWIGDDFANDGNNWAAWITKNVPNGGNILFLGGPAGNSQSVTEYNALRKGLSDKYTFIGETPFQPTNWDPTLTQQLLSADIAKYPKIDVIVSDFGPTLVSALPLFPKSGRSIPALATSDGNSLSCFWEDNHAANPDFKLMTVATGNDNVRLAVDYAVAKATGGEIPTADSFKGPIFEDSVSQQPHGVQCDKNLPGDVYLSAQMPGATQATLGK
ncbi:substrate-binding domain-containing protein [Galbitalea soli]|uniref:Substrate-binding domain-containing protein n=1 Tax=Galbitalea soli TaxID=1268042 RepID=A0A7C9TQZ9_9MICO|nr:substrate-binding domain-containing protein [Galbitalea soli]NEM91816.1 substrate-binding domain-containing protein [Galbitalea soli]NYJ29351.1 ribose transport system substrate-binding protein [Galbitalea soli]